MAADLVLLTGGTGHVGFRTLVLALQAGYRVRAAVRSQAKADAVLKHPHIQALKPGAQLSFVIVPDLTTPGAYDEAAKGATYIVHIASPLPTGDPDPTKYHETLIEPALKGTLGMLESAKKAGGVKRVVVTSSMVAMIPFSAFTSEVSHEIYNAENRIPFHEGPYASEFAAYSASKTAALNEAEAWVAREKPRFDVVFIHPSFIIGRDTMITTAKGTLTGTNKCVLDIVLGHKAPYPLPGSTVHNEDVARMHVEALNPKVPAGNYVAHSNNPRGTLGGTKWEDAKTFVEKHFANAVEDGVFPNDGTQPSHPVKIDARKTEGTFGFEFLDYEEQVKSVVGHYVELAAKG